MPTLILLQSKRNLKDRIQIGFGFFSQEKKFDEVVVQVKKSKHKYVIGKKGETINQILVEFGVVVEMPSSESDSETVTLRGPQDKLPFGEFFV